jgi:hypothetical protein
MVGRPDSLGGACPAETALTPVGRMDAMRKRLAAVRAATAAIRPALMHFYEALDLLQIAAPSKLLRLR